MPSNNEGLFSYNPLKIGIFAHQWSSSLAFISEYRKVLDSEPFSSYAKERYNVRFRKESVAFFDINDTKPDPKVLKFITAYSGKTE
ncbi:hypothetical protein ABK040_004645 [Willaertia magna]